VSKSKRLLSACFVLFSMSASALWGQVSSAAITGQVKDPAGRVIPKAKITVTEEATGVVTSALSNETGEYTLPLLKPGTYDIVVQVPGFQRFEEKALALSAGDHPTVDVPLTVGDVGMTVEVTAAPPLLGTEDANIGQTVPGELLANIPLSGRTPMSVAQFTVGVVATTNPVGVRPFDNSAVAGFSVGGLPNKNSEILMDGSPDNASDNAPAYELPLDAAREVTIKVFESDTTYGHSGGAVANQITKSGTNRLHGTLSEFHQDNDLNAYPYFTKRTPGAKISVSRRSGFPNCITVATSSFSSSRMRVFTIQAAAAAIPASPPWRNVPAISLRCLPRATSAPIRNAPASPPPPTTHRRSSIPPPASSMQPARPRVTPSTTAPRFPITTSPPARFP
jgi:hypothetical protein